MKLNSNKGMYLEEIINNSIKYYTNNDIAIIHKLPIPIKIFENKDNIVKGKLYLKSNVDYYGIYRSKFICIEAKQTCSDKFYLNNISEHQWKYMMNIKKHGGESFLILYYSNNNIFFKIDFSQLTNIKQKYINLKWCYQNAQELKIFFPGRINIL